MAPRQPTGYEYIDTEEAVIRLVTLLKGCSKFAVDCEGVLLGRDGELCLMQIATPRLVFVLDVVVLGSRVFDLGMYNITTFLYTSPVSMCYCFKSFLLFISLIKASNFSISSAFNYFLFNLSVGMLKASYYYLKW